MPTRSSLGALRVLLLFVAGASCSERNSGTGQADAGALEAASDGATGAEGGQRSEGDAGSEAGVTRPLSVNDPGTQTVAERASLLLALEVTGGRGRVRVVPTQLPPGARWDEATRMLSFVPDFIQGGRTYPVVIVAWDDTGEVRRSFEINVSDTVKPPAPVVAKSELQAEGWTRLTVNQATDDFLDSPGFAGRTFGAVVSVPTAPTAGAKYPVRVALHGFGGSPDTSGWSGEYRVFPADPNNTYWWGYGDRLPGGAATSGNVPAYTARRVLHLLEWVLTTFPNADAERVYLDGVSMGGAGAMTLGLLQARHFCHVRAIWGQAVPRNHRPSRVSQLSTLWGPPAANLPDADGMGAWDRMDLTRVVRDVPEARDQFLTIKHGKDDGTIHFGAVVIKSAVTNLSFYQALRSNHVGHFAAWDEGAHGPLDPVLGDTWWTAGWDPVFDQTSSLRCDRAFPAFSSSSADRNPGTGQGNGQIPWSEESGYAANVNVAGDTGWDGDVAGTINRLLRWDSTKMVDTVTAFEVPVHVLDGAGSAPPKAGYPTKGDRFEGGYPVVVDITPRRVQAFRTQPGEVVSWSFGSQQGTATADATGAVTIPALELTATWKPLRLARTNP